MDKNELLEIIFLLKHKVIYEKNNDFYYNWRELYKVSPSKVKTSCLEKGYYIEATPEAILNTLIATELKEILKTLGLKTSGAKKELIKRICDELSPGKIKADYLKKPFYILSSDGEDLVEKHKFLELYEKYLRADETDIFDFYNKIIEKDDVFKVLENILLELTDHYKKNNKYNLLKFKYLKLSKFYKDYEVYDMSLKNILKATYIEFSGWSAYHGDYPEAPNLYPKQFEQIEEYMEELNYDSHDLKELYLDSISEFCFPNTIFTDIEVFEYILRIIDEGTNEVKEEIGEIVDNLSDELEDLEYDDDYDENPFVVSKVEIENKNELSHKIKTENESTSPEKVKFFKTKWFIILSYIVFWPLAVFLGLKYKIFDKKIHIGIGIAILLMMFLGN